MSSGVFTNEYRVGFVQGWLTGGTDPADGSVECGDGTSFPMEVTLDQVAEIYYRVKDAWFTAGEVTFTIFGSPGSYTGPTSAPAARYTFTDATDYQIRGYTDAGVDIGDDERELWADDWNAAIINAFSYDTDDADGDNTGPEWFSPASRSQVKISNRVGVVRVNPGDGFFAVTNRFFLEIEFYFHDATAFIGATTNTTDTGIFGSGSFTDACDYVIQLADSNARCPLYIGTGSLIGVSGSDFIHEAAEWWPYAKAGGGPVWRAKEGATVTTVADVADSLDGKYFVVTDSDGDTWAIGVGTLTTTEDYEISTALLTGQTAGQVAAAIHAAMIADAGFAAMFDTSVSGAVITFTDFKVANLADTGATGFTFAALAGGGAA